MCILDPTAVVSAHWSSIDWAEVWSNLLSCNQESRKMECASIWTSKEKAEKYWKMVQKQQDRYLPIIDALPVSKGTRVLDIGGGPGSIAIPLALKGAQVTVVEPAGGMVEVLKDNIRTHDVSTIEVIQSRWEDVDASSFNDPFDLVTACFSLGMCDIASSIEKMQAVTTGEIHLVWFQQRSSWEQTMVDLWPRIHTTTYNPGPKGTLLYLVLSQLGIAPRVVNRFHEFTDEYTSLDEAVSDTIERLGSVPDDKLPLVRDYVIRNAIWSETGYSWPGNVMISTFSWKVSTHQ